MALTRSSLKTVRNRWAWVLLILQIASIAFLGHLGASLPFDNRIDTFAVRGQESEREHRLFQREFSAPETFLVVLVPTTPLDTLPWPVGESIFKALGDMPGVLSFQSYGNTVPPGLNVTMDQIPFPFRGKDRFTYTALFLWEDHHDRDRQLQDFQVLSRQLAKDHPGQVADLVLAGEPIVNLELNQSSLEVKTKFFPILIVLSLAFLGFLFRSWRVLAATALAVCGALSWTVGAMALMGESMNLVTTLIPALIFVLAIAMQVHVLIGIGYHQDLAKGVMAKLRPNGLVALTTSLGFLSLVFSHVQPIATMGKYMALGIWFIFLWSHLTHFGISTLLGLHVKIPHLPFFSTFGHSRFYHAWSQNRWVLWGFVGIIIAGFWWLPQNPSQSNGLMYFQADHPIRQATDFLQENVTGASQIDLLLPNLQQNTPWVNQLPELMALEDKISSIPEVRHQFSLAKFVTFAQALLPIGSNANTGWNLVQSSQASLFQRYCSQNYYRVQLLVDSTDREGFEAIQAQIQNALASSPWNDSAHIAGPLARVIEIQKYLLQSLATSLSITIALVLILMMVFLKVVRRPLLILLPNLVPLSCISLFMGLFKIETTISSVMVFSIAFGIAVDDTIHLLYTYFHRSESTFHERWSATFQLDAKAISLTTLCLTAGFFTLVTSDFTPTRDFGLLMAIGMVSALAGDLLGLPPLLIRERGRRFPEA